MIAFARIAGAILLLAFGSMHLALRAQTMKTNELRERIDRSSLRVFVTIESQQRKDGFVNGVQYYFTYTGIHGNRNFQSVEQVASSYYHLNSVGKNVVAEVYVDPARRVHTHLLGNEVPYGRDFPMMQAISLYAAAFGTVLLLAGMIWPGRPRTIRVDIEAS